MSAKLRVGIPLIGGKGWLGGVSYVENLIKALRMLPSDESPFLHLIVRPDMVEELELHRHLLPLVDGLYSLAVTTTSLPGVRNYDYKELGEFIDFLFPINSDVVNELCSASWIPDFQHIYLPHLFSSNELLARDTAFARIAETAKLVVFSSKDAANDFSKLYPSSPAITRILHFHTLSPEDRFETKPGEIVKKYSLPDRFILCSNQFWSHKNHKLLFCALAELIKNNQGVHLVCTGATTDYRSADHFNNMLRLLQELNIQEYVHIMGTLPRNDQIQIMRHSLAVVQPSLFEGWSTVVEDARSLGKTVILSDLAVHYEQSPDHAYYFDRHSIDSLHNVLETVLPGLQPGPDIANEEIARKRSVELAIEFARNFMAVAHEACGNFITSVVEKGRSMTGVARTPLMAPIIATSLFPGNAEIQKMAVESWKKLGYHIISVNSKAEISQLMHNFQEVEFVESHRNAASLAGKPLIFLDDILTVLEKSEATVCGIINSDIILDAPEGFIEFIEREARNALVFGVRTEIATPQDRDGELFAYGFDYFFFDKGLINAFKGTSFCLGAPWWDYWLPTVPLICGVKVKQLVSPVAFHVTHVTKWVDTLWDSFSDSFFDLVYGNRFDAACKTNFFADLIALGFKGGCHSFAVAVLGNIKQQAQRIHYPASNISYLIENNRELQADVIFSRGQSCDPEIAVVQSNKTRVFPESLLAHKWLDGLKGLEIGPSAHNPFGLNTRNVGILDEIYENEQLSLVGKIARLDVIARADEIPLPDESEDFVLSSHVVEHCPDLIKTLVEWYRIVKQSGYIFMIVPHRYAAPSDRNRPLTDWPHILTDFRKGTTELSEPEAGKFGHCHYHVFSPETMKDCICRIFGSRLTLVDSQEFDDKLGNGFTLVYRKEMHNSQSLPWDYAPSRKGISSNASQSIEVSAIVSTYNAEHFMRGCLEDLTSQTLFAKGQMKIIVVDSASPQNEAAIVREFQAFHGDKITYIRTDARESIYQAWNRAIRAAQGRYITNANTDDRHRADALEILVQELDSHPDVALVYADVFVTNLDNQTFDSHIRCGYHLRPDYKPEIMLSGCHMGPQPMWRKSIHDEIGYFSEDLRSAADYEFWCRMALKRPLLHLRQFLGLYYENPAGFCNADVGLSRSETTAIQRAYAGHLPSPFRSYTNNLQYHGNTSPRHFVNICMVTYNRLEFTRQAIKALLFHTDFPYVLTVIDNASSDGTREYLLEQKRMGVIKNLVRLNENVGVAKASNLAWSLEPEAAYYLKLDNDIVIQKPGWLLEMIRVVEALTEAGAVAYNFETTSYEAATAYGVQFRPKSSGNLGGACILIPKRTHVLLGYWCEDYGLYGEEDADYGARIRTAGLFNIYMEDEQIGLHLPAGRAAIIDNTLTARDGIEEETYSEYRAWKDDARRLNVLSGRYIRNVESYAQREGAVHLDSAFVRAWHDKQSIKADKKADRGAVDVPVTIPYSKPKIGVFASAPLHCACPQLRLISALACLHETGELEYVDVARLLENVPATFVEELVGMSALILQRSKIAFWPYEGLGPLLEKTGTKLILEVDDAVMQAPKANPLYEHFQSIQHEFEEYFRHADLITVSTPYLKELYSHYNQNVVVLPNCIDTKIWKCEPPCVPIKSQLPLKILFSGTPSHVEDFAVLRGAIHRILEEFPDEVELIVWGNMIPEFLTHPKVSFMENYVTDYSHYAVNLTDLKADIGIVPLEDNVFNNAKSAIKWLEYSVCGIAGIFSSVGEYKNVVKHGKTGLIVENNEADWYAAIKELIVNRQLRTSIAKTAYSDVMTKHTVAQNAHKWLEAYRSSDCIPGACGSAGAVTISPCESKINAAIRFHQAGQLAEAEPMYRDILAAEPDNFDALHLLGVLAYQSGRLDESLELLSTTIQKHRSQPSAFISLGNTLTSLNRYNEAAEYYHQALELEPDNAGIYYNLGNVLHFLDRNEEAVSWYQKALAIKPDFIEVHNHLGNALRKLGRLEEAEASLRLALKLNADVSGVHNNLGNVLMDLGRLDEAEASFRHALKLKPNYFVAHSNLLFVQNYSACHDIDSHLELARSYGRMVGKDVAARFTSWNCPQPAKPLRVGLVSGDFNNHPVGFFLEDVLAHVDASRIELIAYCTQRKCDDLTARIMPFFSEWRQLEGLDDESAAHLIHKDGVHVLIDLAGHTAYNRLPVFAWKPAPVQVSWLGYSSTTGVPEIDYILGNPYSTPSKESHHFTETIWRLPETSLCFSFPDLNLDVAQLPALSNGFITFGCFNNLAKLNDGVLSVWSNILKALPTSRLFLKNKQLGESSARMEIINRFAAYGVSKDRLFLEGRSPRLEYLRAYNRVDIVLDPFPFPGGTTTVEGLWMGVPFVTKRGDRFISHQGEMIAQNTGLLSEWIAKDDEEYLAKAIYFSSNLEYLAGLRTLFRRHLRLSPLFNAPRFARHLEQALWGMWDRFEMNK